MAKERFKVKNTAGMFDLVKGVAIIIMIAAHTLPRFPKMFDSLTMKTGESTVNPVSVVIGISYFALRMLVVPTFFIVSGYGFRKGNVYKTLKKQAKMMFIPYFITSFVTAVVHLFNHYLFFGYFPDAVRETAKIALGGFLGIPVTTNAGGIDCFSNGPVWFLLAMFWGWNAYNIIENCLGKKMRLPAAVAVSCVGWGLSYLKVCPFSISPGLASVFYYYLGYYVKKENVFSKQYSLLKKCLFVLFVTLPVFVMCSFGLLYDMAAGEYGLGIITIIEAGLFSIPVIYFLLTFNRYTGFCSNLLRRIGRYSLYILCIHSIEMMAFPLYVLTEKVADNVINYILFVLGRVIVDCLICFVFVKVKAAFAKRRGLSKSYV